MQARVHFHGIAAFLGTALLIFAGVASAQLDKQETKCANSINKGAAKVAKAQAGDNSACIKDYGKRKILSAEACITSDPKGKVAKAISKIKTSDCTGGAPSLLPGLQTSSSGIGDIMKAKDLKLIHDLFGTDLDVSIVDAGVDKAGAKCQAAIAKAAGKCQDAKLSSFNSCKKEKLKADDTDIEACLGTGTGGIPDGKGKIQKKCGGDFDLAKKCAGITTPLDALVPGCAPGVTAACIDQKIECRVCLALNALDGLTRDCDEFDDGLANGSCIAEECEVLNAAECYLPYPSTHFLVPANTGTGFRLNLPQLGMPKVNGPPTLVGPYNAVDGFSPMVHALMHFPQGVDPELSNAARLLAPGCCGQPSGPPWIDTRTYDDRSLEPNSPTVLMDALTGERILHFIEVDANASSAARQVVFLRPGRSLFPGRRYIIAARDLRDPNGNDVQAESAFAALRDGVVTTSSAIEQRRAYMDAQVFSVLEAFGVPRGNLVLAFDFVTQSEDQLTYQMLFMRDDAYAWVAGVDADPNAQPFSVDSVATNDCNAPGEVVWREVSGTFESPLFLSEDPDLQGIARLLVDANGTPLQNGFIDPPFGISIPCSVLDPNAPTYPIYLGHGFLGSGVGMVQGTPDIIASAAEWNYIAGGTDWSGFSSSDLAWLTEQIVGNDGLSRLNNYPALPDRIRQAMINALVLTRMMKLGIFNRHPDFRTPADAGVFPGPGEEIFYYGVSLGGIMGTWMSALTPDIVAFGLDVPAANFISCLTQRSSQFGPFAAVLTLIGLADPMQSALMLALQSELFVSAEAAGYAYHITSDPLPGSGAPKRILMLPAWLDKQVPNICTEIAARTLGLPNLEGSIQQGLQEMPDLVGPVDSAMVVYDAGSFDLFNPLHEPFIPPLKNLVPSSVCDPHGARRRIPAGIVQLTNFLRPGGQVENFCEGPGNLCDADRPFEIAGGATEPCDPLD